MLASGSKDVSDDVAAAFATKHDLKPHEIKVAVSHLYDAHAEKIAVAAAAAASASPVSAAAPIVLDASPAKPAAAKKNPAATAHGGLPGKPLAAASSPSAKPATATVTFATKTGISAEVRVDLVCGPARGTLVLPKGYKQKQEYVVYPDGRKISPAAFERDGGKEKSKSWKNSCIVVTSDAFNGKTFKRWVDATGYHPVGTEIEGAAAPADEKKKKSKKSSKEKSKKAEEEDEEEVEKSVFERNLEPLLDDAGGIKAIDMTGRFVWLMRNALKNAERSLVISVIHRTSKPIMRSFVDGSDGVKVLYEWCAAARDTNKSSLVLKILKTLRKLPVTFAVLEKTPEFAKFVNKLRKYAPPGKESEDLTIQVQDNAMELKAKWVKMITAENAAKEAAAAKKAAAAKAAAAPPVVGVKRDAAAAAAAAATAAAAKRPRVDAVPTPPQPAVAKPTLNPKPAAPAPTKIAAPAPSSTKIGSAATTTKVTTTKVTTTKVTTTISRPASSALSFGGINIRGAGFPSKPSGGDASKATSAKPAKPASPPPPKFKYSKPTSARAKKGLSWAADTALEAVQFFFKDDAAAKPPSPPSISRADADGGKDKDDDENETEDDAEAMKKARQRQERELAAEARAANLTRQRRLNEMRAIGSWRRPVTYVYPKDVEIESGSESTEAKRMAQRVSRVPETTYAMASLIPASPGEAPGEAPHDDAKTPAVPVVAAKQQPQQQQQQQQQQGVVDAPEPVRVRAAAAAAAAAGRPGRRVRRQRVAGAPRVGAVRGAEGRRRRVAAAAAARATAWRRCRRRRAAETAAGTAATRRCLAGDPPPRIISSISSSETRARARVRARAKRVRARAAGSTTGGRRSSPAASARFSTPRRDAGTATRASLVTSRARRRPRRGIFRRRIRRVGTARSDSGFR